MTGYSLIYKAGFLQKWEKRNDSTLGEAKGVPLNFDRRSIQVTPTYSDPTEILCEMLDVLSRFGLRINGLPQTTGQIVRADMTDEARGKKSGWYVAYDGDVFNCVYGNHKTSETHYWSSIERHVMTSAQIAGHQRQMKVAQEQREVVQQAIYAEAAEEADRIIGATEISTYHDYADRKKISGEYLVYQTKIAIPAYDEQDNISIDLPTLRELTASGQLTLINSQNIKLALSRYSIAVDALRALVIHISPTSVIMARKYPELIQLDVKMRNVQSDIFSHQCQFEKMKEDKAFINDIVDNGSRMKAFTLTLKNQQNMLELVHDELDKELGIIH